MQMGWQKVALYPFKIWPRAQSGIDPIRVSTYFERKPDAIRRQVRDTDTNSHPRLAFSDNRESGTQAIVSKPRPIFTSQAAEIR
jgi:hypothetical protein